MTLHSISQVRSLKVKGSQLMVQTFVEEPEVHILGRSTSSLQDQLMFSECRRECISELDQKLTTKAGTLITDKLRYFHGDGPAHQFEAGNKIGRHYPCVGCQAKSSCFDDLAHSFRANHLTLDDRQTFMLQGVMWKNKSINPLNDLKVASLRSELEARGIPTHGKHRPELEKELTELQKGISNFPALLQPTPQASLESAKLTSMRFSQQNSSRTR